MIFETKGFESLVFIYAMYLFLLLPHLRDVHNFYFKKKGQKTKPTYGWKLTVPSLVIGFSLIVFHTLSHFDMVTPSYAFSKVFIIMFLAIMAAFVWYVVTEKPNGKGPAA